MFKISVWQKDKKIFVSFVFNRAVDSYIIDKADDFLLVIDRFCKRRKIDLTLFRAAKLEIKQASLLTERIFRAILQGILI